ncbi:MULTISPECIES: ComEC/Rec2 family competence protein [unclassified Streptomyces]|uniref:ComEC/Rec2 family competence protein n=1 Tax=unclassified Streptomyces TaxID=2593676 RepID=UPI001F047A54|nr:MULTISPECIES: ComEC/Rec2 family competence protein [unclassified Streptomyces]MCH0565444.1 ComEC/Rec2 family competence protein [Streptomyces sp. MUM 2J]MCH0568187.1 ComEC/Rec2 family competence protein [Streptomyces sp. MUM 136J]
MHLAAGSRLGAAHPRQEGPADLRLVPPALAAWAAAALALDAPQPVVTAAVVVCLAAAAVLMTARRRRPPDPPGPRRSGWPRATAAAVLLCAAAAAASAGLHGADLSRGPVPELARRYATVTAEVEVVSDPRPTRPRVTGDRAAPPSVVLEAEVRDVQHHGGAPVATRTPVLVIVPARGGGAGGTDGAPERSRWLRLLPTTRLRVTGRLAPPAVTGDRIAAVLRVRGATPPHVVQRPSGPQRLAGRLRAGLREATDGLPGDARALLPGLVVGDTARITPELGEAFRETDLAHVLAVSGSNLTLVLALLLGPPGLAQRAERRGAAPRMGLTLRTTALLGGMLTLAFVLVCRPDPSVLRAAACAGVALLALATGRRRSLLPALATAVLLLVLYDPWMARSYGFLLSVLATGALLTLAPRWSAALRRRGVPARLAEALAAAGAAQAVCAPVVALLSARVSLVAVPCNLLAEVAVAPATVLGFAALACAPVVMPVAEALAWCAGWPAGWIAGIARTGAALPGGAVDWPGGWTGALLLTLATLAVVLAGRRLLPGRPWLCGACGVLLLLAVVQPPPLARVVTGWPPPGWRLVMCDVGQGDAVVLAAGAHTGVVVDAGPEPGRVDRCLRRLAITRIPLVVLTHYHADHVAGLPGVLHGRQVGAIETTGFEEPEDQVRFVRKEAARRNIPLTRAAAGERRRASGVDWQVLWPPGSPGATEALEGPNDASVAMLVRSAGLRMLLLGDLEPPAQQALLRSPAAAVMSRVDVLKVAHHGSAYQNAGLIRLVAPRLALISCGADNPYGHPAPGTVAALRAQGAAVLRTDRDGTLAVTGADGGLRVAAD